MTPFFVIIAVVMAGLGAAVYMRSPKMGIILVILSVVAGQLIRLNLGTDVRGGSAIIASDVAILLVAVTWFIRKLTKAPRMTPNRLTGPLLVFIGIALISLIQGYFIIARTGTIDLKEMVVACLYWVRFVEYAILFFVAFDVISSRQDIETLLKWIFTTGVLVAIAGFIQLIVMPDFTVYAIKYGWDPHYYRLLSTFFDPNFVGGYFGMLMSVAIGVLFYERRRAWQILLVLAVLVMGVALILTISRSGLLSFVTGMTVIGIVRSRLFLFLGIVAIVVGITLSPRLFTRITEGFSVDETGVKRIESWTKAAKLTAAYPVLGVGYNNLASVQDDLGLVDEFDVNNRGGFENSLLTILVTTGIVGLLSYMYVLWVFLKAAYDRHANANAPPFERGLSLGILAGVLGVIANSMFINSLLYPFILINFWVFAAMIMYYQSDQKTTKQAQ